MPNIDRETIFNGSSVPEELSKALIHLSNAHQILAQHEASFASGDENPLQHTKKAIKLLEEILNQPR